eukprot:11635153-Ditylum_brightwellii.AAC.1
MLLQPNSTPAGRGGTAPNNTIGPTAQHTTFSNAVEEIDEFEFIQDLDTNNATNSNIVTYSVKLATNRSLELVFKDVVLVMVINSGATMHMFNTKRAFLSLQPTKKDSIVMLGDGTTYPRSKAAEQHNYLSTKSR